ncbi:MAG: hypothetical protein FWF09_06710 [Bacteroidales bacterium]|jgi:hypothetical protein|nr:hypothetical protein [Bacteroidales bacterium]
MKKVKSKKGNGLIKLIALLFAISSVQLSAKTPYEFSLYGGGGYAFFMYRSLSGNASAADFNVPPQHMTDPLFMAGKTSSSGAAGDFGVGFTGFITPHFGLHVGLGLNFYNVGSKVDSLKAFEPNMRDRNGYRFNLYSTVYDYEETHQTFGLSIPLLLQFQSGSQNLSWGRKSGTLHGFYAMTGVKLNILFGNSYKLNFAELYNEAYYPDLDNWAKTQSFAGLSTFRGTKADGSAGFVQAMLTLEAGLKWRVANNMYLYTGVYCDYGLNDPAQSNRTQIGEYARDVYAQIAQSGQDIHQVPQLELLEFAERANLMVIGVKLRLALIRYYDQMSCPQF